MKRQFGLKILGSQSGAAEMAAVLVAAAIGIIVVTNNAEMFSKLGQQNRSNLAAANSFDLKKEIELFLSEQLTCHENFAGIPNDTDQTTDIRADGGATVFEVGPTAGTYRNGLLRIVKWKLNDTNHLIHFNGTNQIMVVDLNLTLQKVGDGGQYINRTIKLMATKSGAANTAIQSCHSLAGVGSDIWARISDDIYNTNTGNVGIGTNAPAAKLDVVGNVLATGSMNVDQDITSSGNNSITGNLLVTGSMGVGGAPVAGTAFAVNGASLVTGNELVTGNFNTGSLVNGGGYTVNGALSVPGNTQFSTLTVSGHSQFNGNLTNSSTTFIDDMLSAMTSLGVAGAAAGAYAVNVPGNTRASVAANAYRFQSNQFCINGNCRTTFATQSCPQPNQVIRGVNTDGTVICSNPNCPAGQLLTGVTASGNPICEDLPNNYCTGANQYMSSVNPANGTKVCRDIPPEMNVPLCPGNQFVTQIRDIASGGRVCGTPTIPATTCPAGQVIRGINADGTANCASPTTANTCASGVAKSWDPNGNVVCGTPFPNPGVPCPAGQFARGVRTDGSLNCMPIGMIGGVCNPGAVAVGLNSDGSPVCGCPPMDIAWADGASVCKGTIAATTVGGTTSVSDASAPTTGSAQFVCGANGAWSSLPNAGATCSGSIVVPLTCAAQTMTWKSGATTCIGTTLEGSSGTTQTISASSGTGSATYSCLPSGSWSAPTSSTCTAPAPPAAVKSVWWSYTNNCTGPGFNSTVQPGSVYIGIRDDDSNSKHNMSEEDYSGNKIYICSNAVTGYAWVPLASPCPGTMVNTFIQDDNDADGRHDLNEEDGTDSHHLCWDGITSIRWTNNTLSCNPGEISSTVTDDSRNPPSLQEDAGSRKRVLCITP